MLRTMKAFAFSVTVALVALAALANIASASTEFTATGGAITATSSGATRKLTFEAGGRAVECRVTMNGRMGAGPIRIAGGAMGEITEVRISECSGESRVERALVEARSPWRITSNRMLSNGGTLPNDKTGGEFTIRGTKFQFSQFFNIVRCLYEGDANSLSPFTRIGEGRYTSNSGRTLPSTFRYVSGPEACPAEGEMNGEFSITSQTITVR